MIVKSQKWKQIPCEPLKCKSKDCICKTCESVSCPMGYKCETLFNKQEIIIKRIRTECTRFKDYIDVMTGRIKDTDVISEITVNLEI